VDDESKLQLTRSDVDSSLSIPKGRSGLIARGRKDAVMLARPSPFDPTDPLSETPLLASKGDAYAQYRLGWAYVYGTSQGVAQDNVQAHLWFNLAASCPTGDSEVELKRNMSAQKYAREALDEIARKMTPQQIAEAQRLARDWKPKQ